MSRYLRLGVLLLAVTAVGCSTDLAPEPTQAVVATLTDTGIALDRATVPSGPISINILNEGIMVHEIEVFPGDPAELHVSQGVADTSGLSMVDEVEDIVPGTTVSLDVDLAPGEYIILCNLPGHYEMAMVTSLTVTG